MPPVAFVLESLSEEGSVAARIVVLVFVFKQVALFNDAAFLDVVQLALVGNLLVGCELAAPSTGTSSSCSSSAGAASSGAAVSAVSAKAAAGLKAIRRVSRYIRYLFFIVAVLFCYICFCTYPSNARSGYCVIIP